MDAFSKSTETLNCENHKMAKVDRNTIQNALNEANELEYELSFSRELDEYEHWDNDWTGYDVEPQDHHGYSDELYLSDDDVMFGYHDYDSGDL